MIITPGNQSTQVDSGLVSKVSQLVEGEDKWNEAALGILNTIPGDARDLGIFADDISGTRKITWCPVTGIAERTHSRYGLQNSYNLFYYAQGHD